MPIHGESYVVNGSDFGTKNGSLNLWEDCSGSALLVASGGKFDRAWHYDNPNGDADDEWSSSSQGTTGDQLDVNHEAIRDPSNYPSVAIGGVEPPHTRTGKVICGRGQGAGIFASAVYVAKDYTRPSDTEWWSVRVYYHRWHPDWTFGSDFNYKWEACSAGNKFTETGTYAYISTGDMTTSGDSSYEMQFFDSGGIGSNPSDNDASTTTGLPNPTAGWMKIEMITHYKTSAGGGWKMRLTTSAGPVQVADETFQTHDSDGYEGETEWQESFGAFYRSYPHDTNALYWTDIYRDVQASNPGRFYLTNHATWGSETLAEIQPWTSWSTTSVTLTCNGGALSDGTVHLHYRDEVNGNQYLGTLTLGESAGSPGGSGGRYPLATIMSAATIHGRSAL